MPNIHALLRGIDMRLETPAERDARMDEFHKRFPALSKAAARCEKPVMRSESAEYYDTDGVSGDE